MYSPGMMPRSVTVSWLSGNVTFCAIDHDLVEIVAAVVAVEMQEAAIQRVVPDDIACGSRT